LNSCEAEETVSITEAPQSLDGALVRSVAPAVAGRIGYDYETGESVPIHYYAIAQYPSDEPRAYLFAVSADHQVVGDSLWDSLAEAAQVALASGHVTHNFELPA
jgi:hypothetical protein